MMKYVGLEFDVLGLRVRGGEEGQLKDQPRLINNEHMLT